MYFISVSRISHKVFEQPSLFLPPSVESIHGWSNACSFVLFYFLRFVMFQLVRVDDRLDFIFPRTPLFENFVQFLFICLTCINNNAMLSLSTEDIQMTIERNLNSRISMFNVQDSYSKRTDTIFSERFPRKVI